MPKSVPLINAAVDPQIIIIKSKEKKGKKNNREK